MKQALCIEMCDRTTFLRLSQASAWLDWELAGRDGEQVFWSGPSLPSDVDLRKRPFVFPDDLWQLGVTLSRLAMPTKPLTVYIEGILHGGFATAAAAVDALPEMQSWRFGKKP